MRNTLITLSLIALVLTGCTGTQQYARPKTAIGAMGGAASGGLLAATFGGNGTGIAAGVILGGLMGGLIGDRLDAADRQAMQQTTHGVLTHEKDNYPVVWRNPQSGHYGSVMATNTIEHPSGITCREFQTSIVIGGKTEEGYGRACRRGEQGAWEIQ